MQADVGSAGTGSLPNVANIFMKCKVQGNVDMHAKLHTTLATLAVLKNPPCLNSQFYKTDWCSLPV